MALARGSVMVRGTHPKLSVEMHELYSPVSGRLDARRVADFLGVSLAQLATAVGKNYQGLYKTPDSPAVQEALYPIREVLRILTAAIDDGSMVRMWLNTPHPNLGGRTALRVILDGDADVVANMLADALAGMPS